MLEDLEPPKKTGGCKASRILDSLNESDKAILQSALVDPAWNMTSLARALTQKGIKVAADTLRSHQGGTCAC